MSDRLSLRSYILKYLFAFFLVFAASIVEISVGSGFVMVINILFLVFVFFQPTDDYLNYIVMTIPSTRLMEVAGISVSVWICVLFIVKKFVSGSVKLNGSVVLLLFTYIMYMTQHLWRHGSIMYGLIQPMKILVVILFLYMNIDTTFASWSYIKCKKVMWLWMAGIGGALLPVMLNSTSIGRLSALNNDSNMLAVEAVFIFAIASVLYLDKQKIMSHVEYSIVMVLSIIVCLLAGSRNGFMLLFFSLLGIFFFNQKKETVWKSIIVFMSLAILAFIALRMESVQQYLHSIQRRLEMLEARGNISNGRFDLWMTYINAFNESTWIWLFGMGSYTFYGISQMAHNMIIEDVASYGLIGIFLLFTIYAKVFRFEVERIVGARKVKPAFLSLVPICIPIIGGLTLHTLTNQPNTIMLYIGVAVVALKMKGERRQ